MPGDAWGSVSMITSVYVMWVRWYSDCAILSTTVAETGVHSTGIYKAAVQVCDVQHAISSIETRRAAIPSLEALRYHVKAGK